MRTTRVTERVGEEKRMRMLRRDDEGQDMLLRGPGKVSARACKVRGRRMEAREGEAHARRTAWTRLSVHATRLRLGPR